MGSKDGWLLIQKPDPETGLKLDPAYAAGGRGWNIGKLAGATLGDPAERRGSMRRLWRACRERIGVRTASR